MFQFGFLRTDPERRVCVQVTCFENGTCREWGKQKREGQEASELEARELSPTVTDELLHLTIIG